jgi:hypothetical protein
MSIMALETIIFFYFLSICVRFLFFLRSFTLQSERSAVGLTMVKIENTPVFYNSEALHIIGIV